MSITASEGHQVASDPDFVKRVEIMLSKVCTAVVGESTDTEGHPERLAYTRRFFQNPRGRAQVAALTVVSQYLDTLNTTDHRDVTDTQIENGLTAVFNALAGVSTDDPA